MGPFRDIDPAFRTQLARRDPAAPAWLDGLPELWTSLSRQWGLNAAGSARTGMTSIVVPVAVGGTHAAVKLVSPVASADDEAVALAGFDGRGAVALLDADSDAQALLLEWLPGPALSTHPDRSAAMRIAGGIAGRLAEASAPAGAPGLATQATAWGAQLRQQHKAAEQSNTALPDAHIALAMSVISELTRDRVTTLTHGDLSLFNILWAERGWVAVDPLLVSGTAGWEAHTVVRSYPPTTSDADDTVQALLGWTQEFTDAAGVDHAQAWSLSFARFAASYYWEDQHGGDPGNVAHLRQVATAMARLCGAQ